MKTSAIEILMPCLEKIAEALGSFYESKLRTKTTDNAKAIESLEWDELAIAAAVVEGMSHYVGTLLDNGVEA